MIADKLRLKLLPNYYAYIIFILHKIRITNGPSAWLLRITATSSIDGTINGRQNRMCSEHSVPHGDSCIPGSIRVYRRHSHDGIPLGSTEMFVMGGVAMETKALL